MSDFTAPLVLAIVSLAGTILTTAVGAYITYYSDERKARREGDKILLKYRDPLLLAATDLQARCYGICAMDTLEFSVKDKEGDSLYKDTLYIYTAYVLGQYLSWVWILRRQAQFMALVSSSPPKWNFLSRSSANSSTTLMQKLEQIRNILNTSDHNPTEHPFMMFKAHQQAIGEIMSCRDSTGEYYCMGYATFEQRWKNGALKNLVEDDEYRAARTSHKDDRTDENMAGVNKISDMALRAHFKVVEDGINEMYARRCDWKAEHPEQVGQYNQGSDGRLRRLQHLLLDLSKHLDTAGTMKDHAECRPCPPAPRCQCSLCRNNRKRDCRNCDRDTRLRAPHANGDCLCIGV